MREKTKDKKEGVEKDICSLFNVVQYLILFSTEETTGLKWHDGEWLMTELVFVYLVVFLLLTRTEISEQLWASDSHCVLSCNALGKWAPWEAVWADMYRWCIHKWRIYSDYNCFCSLFVCGENSWVSDLTAAAAKHPGRDTVCSDRCVAQRTIYRTHLPTWLLQQLLQSPVRRKE